MTIELAGAEPAVLTGHLRGAVTLDPAAAKCGTAVTIVKKTVKIQGREVIAILSGSSQPLDNCDPNADPKLPSVHLNAAL